MRLPLQPLWVRQSSSYLHGILARQLMFHMNHAGWQQLPLPAAGDLLTMGSCKQPFLQGPGGQAVV